jgi:dihydrofolate reductase
MFNNVTADGYFAAADGGLQWAVSDDEIAKAGMDRGAASDTILFGRRTYQMFEGFWRHALDDSTTAPDPHAEGRRSPMLRAMAEWINAATKLVFSRTLKEVTWANARLVGEFDPREIAALKEQAGQNMMIFGSGSIVSQLTEHSLIDEYQFVVNPTLLGTGRQLFNGVSKPLGLKLLEAQAYHSGNVVLRYERATQA